MKAEEEESVHREDKEKIEEPQSEGIFENKGG